MTPAPLPSAGVLPFTPAELDALLRRAAAARPSRPAPDAPAGWRVGDPLDLEAHRARWPGEHEGDDPAANRA